MGQRITIQYSIDLDDLANEMERLVSQVAENVEETGAWMNHIVGTHAAADVLSLNTVNQLNEAREKLAKADHSLTDISTLISSYIQYQSQPPPEPLPQTPSTTLDESIKEFKSIVTDVEPDDEVTD
tara:strand:- start:710 stop:1087 length:378 start_codon:yes stop_codon:yes gene_type:complete